ncbi:MAG TPA: RNA polymerase sigma factor [Candidatus Moranbacteria bacterium]|nr:RNA polymerase sigma factor [Candidatus Moranbacteria bacterium]
MAENNIKKELSDNELVEIVRSSDQERYGEIIERYQGKLFAYLFRLIGSKEEVQDILQDVFIKAYKNLMSFDAERKFSSWIYRIAHNEAVNYIKRKSIKRFIPWEDISATKDKIEMASFEEGAEKAWIRKETGEEVNLAMDRLPLKYKQILVLRYYSDKSYEEISEILGKPVNTVGTLISRAKKKLSEELEGRNLPF